MPTKYAILIRLLERWPSEPSGLLAGREVLNITSHRQRWHRRVWQGKTVERHEHQRWWRARTTGCSAASLLIEALQSPSSAWLWAFWHKAAVRQRKVQQPTVLPCLPSDFLYPSRSTKSS